MSLRETNKDHLPEHAGVELAYVAPPSPDHGDPLRFWTENTRGNCLVDLTEFATGRQAHELNPMAREAGPYSGRPKLIRQLAPAISQCLTDAAKTTVSNYLSSLRFWWRLLDAVEQAARQAGEPMTSVEEVTQLTRIHAEYAYRVGMRRMTFLSFTSVVNKTLLDLGKRALGWETPEDPDPDRRLPPDEDCKAIRIRVRQEWGAALRWFSTMDRVRADGFQPCTAEEEDLLAHWSHFERMARKTGLALPSADELRDGINKYYFKARAGLSLTRLRLTAFPDGWQAEAAFLSCLIPTGWNVATLLSLDATEAHHWLREHPRQPGRYLLVGTKARAGGAEQPVEGLWKTRNGPGFIIRTWLERTAPLRAQLQAQLAAERAAYDALSQSGVSAAELTGQFEKILKLEQGCRSVWLFAGQNGIRWLSSEPQAYRLDGKVRPFLDVLFERFNRERAARGQGPVQRVTPSDFRDMFALYAWQASGGNLVSLMNALRHARIRTTEGYADTNLLNRVRDEDIRRFLHNLFRLLGEDRFDLTILAHLQRHGDVTPEMEARLREYRALQRSRLAIGCRNPSRPPPEIQPAGSASACRPQRCLLCRANAVILPESLAGIAMRVEELEFINNSISFENWSDDLETERANGLAALALFDHAQASRVRERWKLAIESGQHLVPGFYPEESSSVEPTP